MVEKGCGSCGRLVNVVKGVFVGEKESVIEVRAKGRRMVFAAMRIKASKGESQRAMHVGDVKEGLRSSMKLRALEMRSSVSAFGSR